MINDPLYTGLHAMLVFRRRWLEKTSNRFPGKEASSESFDAYLVGLQERLWSGRYIRGSTGHFHQLWVRDLGLFCREYIELGYAERLRKSLEWALPIFEKHGSVTTTIWPSGRPYNVFGYPGDSLPLMLWALWKMNSTELIHRHESFLRKEVESYKERCFASDGFTRKNLDLCGLKDAVVRKASLYNFCMNFLLDQMGERWGLSKRSQSNEAWREELLRRYDSSQGFLFEDLQKTKVWSADAQLMPFWLELLPLDDKWKEIWEQIRNSDLAKPTLIRQTNSRHPEQERFVSRMSAPNYQGDTVWANLAAIALCLAGRSGQSVASDLKVWADLCRRDGELMELYTTDLRPYRSFFYRSDEGMNWSIGFLWALRFALDGKNSVQSRSQN